MPPLDPDAPKNKLTRIVIIFVYHQSIAMPEVIVKYKTAKALKALQDLTRMFDIVIEKPVDKNAALENEYVSDLPITFAKKPDVKALAGIWEGRDITIEALRKEAWGDRL
jgi:hypothetical protein